MNFLKGLQYVFINDRALKKEHLTIRKYEVAKDTETFKAINPEYLDCPIKIAFAYTDYQKSDALRKAPSFYKYFPMGDEINGFSFIIHCDSFDIEANRRKLHESSKNKTLLPQIAKFIIMTAEELKQTDFDEYCRLYANLLLSRIPVNDNNRWLNGCFFDHLLEYLRRNIPVRKAWIAADASKIKIKSFSFPVKLADLGLADHQWFFWFPNKDGLLIEAASTTEKLGIESWRLRDLFVRAELNRLNKWIAALEVHDYTRFIGELSKEYFNEEGIERLTEVQLFKFSDGNFYSIREGKENEDLLFLSKQTINLRAELKQLGFFISELQIAEFSFYERISDRLADDENVYGRIASRTVKNTLTAAQKLRLFAILSDPGTKFSGIGKETLGKLPLFCSEQDEVKPLHSLLAANLKTPDWLSPYKIKKVEYAAALDNFTLPEAYIYAEIILPEWESIVINYSDSATFYNDVARYFNMDEDNAVLQKQAFVNTVSGMKYSQEIFFSRYLRTQSQYADLQSAFTKLSGLYFPERHLLPVFEQYPFKLENDRLSDINFDEKALLTTDEVKALLHFASASGEHFFEDYHLVSQIAGYNVVKKTEGNFQYYTSDQELVAFIEETISERFYPLPKGLAEFRELTGILREEPLHVQIVGAIDVNESLQRIVDVVKYEEAKRAMLIGLKSVVIDMTGDDDAALLSAKVLDMACKNLAGVNLQEQFKSKLRINTLDGEVKVNQVPAADDHIYFRDANISLSLSALLPEDFKNVDLLRETLTYYVARGVPEVPLKKLFGIQQEIDFAHVLGMVGSIIDTAEKLAFVLLYHRYCEPLDLTAYTVATLGGDYGLNYDYYAQQFSFIDTEAVLSNAYHNISSILPLPFMIDEQEDIWLYAEPHLSDKGFHCPYLKDNPSEPEQLELLGWLYERWANGAKETFRKLGWSQLNKRSANTVLGFEPTMAVFLSHLALPIEHLPEHVQKWNKGRETEQFLFDLGVNGAMSRIIQVRTYFCGEGNFQPGRILTENNERLLRNTVEWLKYTECKITSADGYLILKEVISTINRIGEGSLELQEFFDLETLKNESEQLKDDDYVRWVEETENKYQIFLYPGTLPKYAVIDGFDGYRFREFADGHVYITEENIIYMDASKDVRQLLYQLVAQEDVSADDVLKYFKAGQGSQTDIQALKERIRALESMIANMQRVSGRDKSDITTRVDQYTDVIKERSEGFLLAHLRRVYSHHQVVSLNITSEGKFSESWQGHDFRIEDDLGKVIYYIDCKGTPAGKRTFYVTQNEWEFFLDHAENYCIWRVFNIESVPNFLYIDNLLEWILDGKVVPYLEATELVAGGKVFLTVK